MCRQSMQTKWMAPSQEKAARFLRAVSKNAVKACEDISPEAMTNSRCRIAPKPPMWPSIGTL